MATGEEYSLFWANNEIVPSWKAYTNLHMLWNAKHFSMLAEDNHLAEFENGDFGILDNRFTAKPGYW